MENPQEEHWMAVKRIFRYLQGTKMHGICYEPSDKIDFRGYSDVDWAGDLADRNEAEHIALSLAIQEGKWIHRLLCEVLTATEIMTKGLHGPRHKDLTAILGIRPCSH
ncbi:unnamed protein product [Peronospora destructor]|uniref:Uncharacterized protein n=1 Tax=Peronospora destructor TaxID=86335 RepID=A0AAV0UGD3_9STRA|nr:unnamed protein product [Peronospora destructor]